MHAQFSGLAVCTKSMRSTEFPQSVSSTECTKVSGDGGGHRVGGDHGVHTAVGKAEETQSVVSPVRTTNNKNPLKGIN